MYVLPQSSCSCCYDGDMQFPTFAECWHKNPTAHMFPDQTKMRKGAYKTCFIGVLGVAEDDLPQIKKKIHKHNPMLGTRDIVTCIELGVDHRKKLFDFNANDNVIVVADALRQALVNRKGVLKRLNSYGGTIEMVDVLEKDIRRVTKGSVVRVMLNTSPLYKHEGTALYDGALHGWCCVNIGSQRYIMPTMWVETISAEEPRDAAWENRACVDILYEQCVPTHLAGTCINFTGDGILHVAEIIKIFDPGSTVTPKIFATFDTSTRDWSDQAQKDAMVDSICELHAHSPLRYFKEECISANMHVYFNWEGCSGTQSIFESKQDRFFYVDNTNPSVRSRAFIGWSLRALGEIQWEIAHDRQVGGVERILQRNEDLMVTNSSVAHRYDHTRTGSIRRCMPSAATCMVEWNKMVGGVSMPSGTLEKEAFVDLERAVFTQQVVMPPGLIWGTVQTYAQDSPPTYVLVTFKGNNSITDEMCAAWFNLKQLDKQRLRHQLRVFLSYPWRTVRFSVQERVGVSIEFIANGRSNLVINTSSALYNFRQAIALFCRGVARMHREDITHNDLHIGNLTITQAADGESFSVKMIDFDRMRKHPPNEQTCRFHKDLRCIVRGLDTLVEKAQCSSLYPSVQHNHALQVQALSHLLFKLDNDVGSGAMAWSSSKTADFLSTMATDVVHTQARKRPLPL